MNTEKYVDTFRAVVLLCIQVCLCMYSLTNATFMQNQKYISLPPHLRGMLVLQYPKSESPASTSILSLL